MDSSKKFVTDRTKHLRTTELSRLDERVISQIEEYGCSLISVGSDCADDFGWTYSLGIFNTCGQPELITIGLSPEVAKSCLNEVTRRMRAGIDLARKRQKKLISNVDCELRTVDSKWVSRLMNFSNWYNGNTAYPVLQVIYPDLQNRFPWEPGFENRFVQPLLQPDAVWTAVEQQFWDSNGSESERLPC